MSKLFSNSKLRDMISVYRSKTNSSTSKVRKRRNLERGHKYGHCNDA